ncbi:RNA polymerase sigma factor [Kutzneria chonburiensis]|uniref:RNA polymerase sigma factor n=1 Tax=Kutzneria chonburiensis TaxID=1483604 RepID=A0ABV6MSX9_9PSEU|nr:RNA polymerase sigma factor [Kutzneria chonburiensis]
MDVEAFEQLYHAHHAALMRYGTRRVGHDAAKDVVAETFLVAWRRPDAVPLDDPLPWLYATARRVLANHVRSETRRGRLDERIGAVGVNSAVEADHADGVAVRADVLRALAELPAADQEVLMLTEWDGLSAQTAAEVVGCSLSAFKVRLHRARRRLAARLAPPRLAPVRGEAK